MTPPIIMHVNYCEQGQTINEMCQKAVRWGYDGIEFRRIKRGGQPQTPQEYVDEIATAAERHGLKHILFGHPGPNLVLPDASQRVREIEEYITFIRIAAARCELTMCNILSGVLVNPDKSVGPRDFELHGSGIATPEIWEWAVAGYRQIGAVAEELGIRFAFETHMNYLHDLPEPTKKLVDLIGSPAIGVNLDYGNIAAFKNPPPVTKVISELGGSLYYVHLKNSMPIYGSNGRMPCGLGEGSINHREYLTALKESGYNGFICIEAPRPGDREWYAQQDIAYCKSVLADIGW
jgi:sugar phosphate isomerase/epimerase